MNKYLFETYVNDGFDAIHGCISHDVSHTVQHTVYKYYDQYVSRVLCALLCYTKKYDINFAKQFAQAKRDYKVILDECENTGP